MTELNKCPFCGGEAKIEKYTDGTYAVVCSSKKNECEVQPTTWWHWRREKAIEAWNRRAE